MRATPIARVILGLAFLSGSLLPAAAQAPDQKRQDILALFDAAGVSAQVDQISQIMIAQQRPMLEALIRGSASDSGPAADPRIAQILIEEIEAESRNLSPRILERMIPEWESRFSGDEIRELKAFYLSPIGRKLTTTMPELLQRGAQIGQQVGQEMGQAAVERTVARYRQLAPAK
jgi:uncharacterized protein